jgi:uncharacterized protein (TIGR03085 family)
MAEPGTSPTPLVDTERELLCDLFDELGPHAPTLCARWDAHHLVAHLWLRESSPVDMLKAVVTSGKDSILDTVVSSCQFGELVAGVRGGPSTWSVFAHPQVERLTGSLEFFVHHEDLRRAQLRWTVRDLPGCSQDELWSRLRSFAKVTLRRSPVGAQLKRADTEHSVVGAKGGDLVTVRGAPSELALFAFGRTEVARVELDGSANAVQALCNARLGV